MMTKLICILLLTFALLTNGTGLAAGETWQDGWLNYALLSEDETGNRTYSVSLQSGAVDLNGTPLKAEDYACALLLTNPDAIVNLISENAFELVIAFDGELASDLWHVAPHSVGLQVVSGEEGAYLLGDVKRALAVFAEMNQETEVQFAEVQIPLSDGSELILDDEPEHTPAEGEEMKATLSLSDPGEMITVGDRFHIEVKNLSGTAVIHLPEGIVSESGAQKLSISPATPGTPMKFELTAKKAGQYELKLTDEATGAEIAQSLRINVQRVTDLPTAKIRLESTREDGLCTVGDEVVLAAEFDEGADGLELQWQRSPEGGGGVWQDIPGATGTRYTFTITEENRNDLWRVIYKRAGDDAA